MGSALSGYAHLDVFHYADGCGQPCRRHQFGPACVDGRFYRVVSEVVSPSHRAWIAVLLHFFDGASALVFGGYGFRLALVLRNGAGVFRLPSRIWV